MKKFNIAKNVDRKRAIKALRSHFLNNTGDPCYLIIFTFSKMPDFLKSKMDFGISADNNVLEYLCVTKFFSLLNIQGFETIVNVI